MILSTQDMKPSAAAADLAQGVREIISWMIFPSFTALDYAVEKIKRMSEQPQKEMGFSGFDFPILASLPQFQLPDPFGILNIGKKEETEVFAEDPCKKYFLQKWNAQKNECELDVPMIVLLSGAAIAIGMVIAK